MTRRSPGDGTLFKRKDGLWVAGFTVDGRQYRVTAKNRNTAIEKRRELRKQLDAGVRVSGGRAKLSVWLEKWLEIHKPRVDPTTFRDYETTVRLYITPHIGQKRMDKLTPDHVRDMITTLQESSPRNAQKAYTVLRLSLKQAVAERKLDWNPAAVVDRPKHTASHESAFTAKEALLDNRCVVHYNPYFATRYKCHINVEICSSVEAVKYLYKYTYKGPDRACLEHQVDETTKCLDARYVTVTAPEAC